jgi:hypothetical protein
MGNADTTYCTLAELRNQIYKKGTTKSPDTDANLTLIITAVSRGIDQFTGKEAGYWEADTSASARYFSGSGNSVQWIDQCIEVEAVAVKDSATDDEDSYTAWTVGTVGTTTDADVFPASGDPKYPNYNALPYNFLLVNVNGSYAEFPSGRFTSLSGFRPEHESKHGLPTVKVTAKWGRSATVLYSIKQACIVESARMYKRGEGVWADAIANVETGELRFVSGFDPATLRMLDRLSTPSIGWTGGG